VVKGESYDSTEYAVIVAECTSTAWHRGSVQLHTRNVKCNGLLLLEPLVLLPTNLEKYRCNLGVKVMFTRPMNVTRARPRIAAT